MDMIIDTKGQADLATRDCLVQSDDDLDLSHSGNTNALNSFGLEKQFLEDSKKKKTKQKLNVTKDFDLDEFETDMGWGSRKKTQPKRVIQEVRKMLKDVAPVDKLLEKSVIKPGFEQLESVPTYDENIKRVRALRRRERAKTSGEGWFNMKAPEMTPEVRHDLEVIKMRSALDPKHFYKKNDHGNSLPKHFHIGKVIDSPLDYYSDRLTNKERKKTIVDELMADAAFSKFNKRKYKEIIDEKKKLHYKAHRHSKRLKHGKKGKKK